MKILTAALLMMIAKVGASTLADTAAVSSASADYDGNALILRGNVVLDHGLGKMMADQASLERQEVGRDFPFSLIHLKKDVLLQLKGSSELRCDFADLDFISLKGILSAKENGKVAYVDPSKKGNQSGLCLTSELVELELSKAGFNGKKTDYEIEKILAKREVVIQFAETFTLHADHAVYRKHPSLDAAKSLNEFPGILTAYPKDAKSLCHLLHEQDRIDAEAIDVDLLHSKLSLLHPKGVLISTMIPHVQKGEIRFVCDHLVWDQNRHVLSLKGKIHLHDSSLGQLTSDDELQLTHMTKEGKHELQTLIARGRTTLEYLSEATQKKRRLISYGLLKVDRDHLHTTIDSPTVGGAVPEDKQVYYEEEKFAAHGNKATVEYSQVEGSLEPVAIHLIGNVRLLSRDPSQPKRCGLADRISYSPTTKTVILAANPSKKVLFWDEEQALHMSAQEIHVTFDAATGREVVKGVGAVQFAFSTEENNLLQQSFPFYRAPHE